MKRPFHRPNAILGAALGVLGIFASQPLLAEEEVELPRGAERAIERYEREVADAREDLLESLDRELERATKRGELEVALAIKAKKEEFAGGETDFLGNEDDAENRADLLNESLKTLITNTWAMANGRTVEFSKDGKAHTQKGGSRSSGKWRVEGEEVLVTWSNNITDTIPLPIEGESVQITNSVGVSHVWTIQE